MKHFDLETPLQPTARPFHTIYSRAFAAIDALQDIDKEVDHNVMWLLRSESLYGKLSHTRSFKGSIVFGGDLLNVGGDPIAPPKLDDGKDLDNLKKKPKNVNDRRGTKPGGGSSSNNGKSGKSEPDGTPPNLPKNYKIPKTPLNDRDNPPDSRHYGEPKRGYGHGRRGHGKGRGKGGPQNVNQNYGHERGGHPNPYGPPIPSPYGAAADYGPPTPSPYGAAADWSRSGPQTSVRTEQNVEPIGDATGKNQNIAALAALLFKEAQK